jgi:thermitase
MKKVCFTILMILVCIGCSSKGTEVPNDPLFKNQVSFSNDGGSVTLDRLSFRKSPVELNLKENIHLHILPAWSITKGSKQTVVALLDDGFFYDHVDIRDNIWRNPGETGMDASGYRKETNGVDDDENGYVDDVMGWDFYFNDPDPDCYIYDGKLDTSIQPYPHSMDAMGIIGAKGNNGIGVAGINWDVSMMLLKMMAQGSVSWQNPLLRIPKAAEAIRYAVDNGARVINWSGFVNSQDLEKLKPLKEAIDYAEEKGVLLVVAAGNDLKDIDKEENRIYPACFPDENILTVGEIDFNGELYVVPPGSRYVGGSNYGENNVDIAAIAQNYTTYLRNNCSVYRLGGGTSDSAPVVTGVAALILSLRPDLNAAQVKQIIMESATPLPGLKGKIKCGGMVNALSALEMARSF